MNTYKVLYKGYVWCEMYNHVETKSLDIWIKYEYRNIGTEHKPLFLGWSYLRDAGTQSRGTLGSHWLLVWI